MILYYLLYSLIFSKGAYKFDGFQFLKIYPELTGLPWSHEYQLKCYIYSLFKGLTAIWKFYHSQLWKHNINTLWNCISLGIIEKRVRNTTIEVADLKVKSREIPCRKPFSRSIAQVKCRESAKPDHHDADQAYSDRWP